MLNVNMQYRYASLLVNMYHGHRSLAIKTNFAMHYVMWMDETDTSWNGHLRRNNDLLWNIAKIKLGTFFVSLQYNPSKNTVVDLFIIMFILLNSHVRIPKISIHTFEIWHFKLIFKYSFIRVSSWTSLSYYQI